MSSQPEVIFYVDENLDGEAFVGILRTAGVALVRCRDLNLRGTNDAAVQGGKLNLLKLP